jgi:hypothetical protein
VLGHAYAVGQPVIGVQSVPVPDQPGRAVTDAGVDHPGPFRRPGQHRPADVRGRLGGGPRTGGPDGDVQGQRDPGISGAPGRPGGLTGQFHPMREEALADLRDPLREQPAQGVVEQRPDPVIQSRDGHPQRGEKADQAGGAVGHPDDPAAGRPIMLTLRCVGQPDESPVVIPFYASFQHVQDGTEQLVPNAAIRVVQREDTEPEHPPGEVDIGRVGVVQ